MEHIINFSDYLKEEMSSDPSIIRKELIRLFGEGDVNRIDKFMDENNIDVNYDSGTLLRLSAKSGNLPLIKYLDEIGANWSLRRNLALKTALSFGKLEAAKYILDQSNLTLQDIESIEEYISSSDTSSPIEKSKAIELISLYK